MLSFIFAVAIIAIATLATTVFAMSFVRWMLSFGRFPSERRGHADSVAIDEAPVFLRHLASE